MASLIAYTKKMLIERIKRDILNDFPSSEFNVSDNEMVLYIDQASAFTLVGQVYQGAKVSGNLVMPEAYLTTYEIPSLAKDSVTGYWKGVLPQPPVSLPIGYSVSGGYFANTSNGAGMEVIWIKPNRVGRRKDMPQQFGIHAWIQGSDIYFAPSNNIPLLNIPFYITMAKTRTESLTETLNLPDDAIEMIFNNVKQKLISRMNMPKDIIQDDISQGATNITNK